MLGIYTHIYTSLMGALATMRRRVSDVCSEQLPSYEWFTISMKGASHAMTEVLVLHMAV